MTQARIADASRGPIEGVDVREALRWAVVRLTVAGVDAPRLDAELLLADVLGVERTALYMVPEKELSPASAQRLTELVHRRAEREPLAYILGHWPFCGLDLLVTPSVLVPRPETEELVFLVRDWCSRNTPYPLVVDVGTGSGAIAVSIAHHLPTAYALATDISHDALRVAQENASRHDVADRIGLLQCDLASALRGPVDVVAANLPYVPTDRLPTLEPEVRDYEPRLALDGGCDGLDLLVRLLRQSRAVLGRSGLLVAEIDSSHARRASSLASSLWPDGEVRVRCDMAGHQRFLYVEPCGDRQ